MRIRVLGCSGGIGAGSLTTALMVDNDILIDAGTGIGDLVRSEFDSIQHVFLTHSHLDHIAGLPMLIDRQFGNDDPTPLTVHARKETLRALQEHIFNGEIWPDFARLPTAENPVMRYSVCSPGDTVIVGDREIHAVDVVHSVPSLGFSVKSADGVFAVSGDTKSNETLWPMLNAHENLRVLIIEVSFPDEMSELAAVAGHYTPATLVKDLERLQHEPEIWLTGMKPGQESQIYKQVIEASPDKNIQMLSRGTVLTV